MAIDEIVSATLAFFSVTVFALLVVDIASSPNATLVGEIVTLCAVASRALASNKQMPASAEVQPNERRRVRSLGLLKSDVAQLDRPDSVLCQKPTEEEKKEERMVQERRPLAGMLIALPE